MGIVGVLTGIGMALAAMAAIFGIFYLIDGAVLGLSALFVLVCIIMMMIILIQKPKGGGLSGAFGGAGGSASDVFGSKTGDVLTLTTVILFVLFLGLGVSLTYATRSTDTAETSIEEQVRQARQAEEEGVAEQGAINKPPVEPVLAGEPEPDAEQTGAQSPDDPDPADGQTPAEGE